MTEDNKLIFLQDAPGKSRWVQLKERCPHMTDWGVETLEEGLDGYAKTLVIEPRYLCKDHRNLHSNFYSKKFHDRSAICARVHFFSDPNFKEIGIFSDSRAKEENYIGYAVIRPVAERCLGRTVIDPHKIGQSVGDGFFTLRTRFKNHINGSTWNAHGYPYMSQDREATVCAHTALWSMGRYLSERYTAYPETYPFDFIAGTPDTYGRTVPYRAMHYTDISRLLNQFGCHPQIVDIIEKTESGKEFSQKGFSQLYSYMESGFPVLACYDNHVVSIVGHTIDRDRKVETNEHGWIESSQFLKQFVVVDDNFFPYQLLGYSDDPHNYGKRFGPDSEYSINGVYMAVCPLPEKVYLPASAAKEKCNIYLEEILKQHSSEIKAGRDEPLVTRLFVTTSAALKRRRLENVMNQNKVTDAIPYEISNLHLPHFVWVMEVSPLNLYKKGICTTEIVLDATANDLEKILLYARAGCNLLFSDADCDPDHSGPNLPTFAQFTHNLGKL